MTTYAVLLIGDEKPWAEAGPQERARMYGLHEEFTRLAGERGHTITGGAELVPSAETKVVRGTRGSVTVTDGPYAETVEQLGGFYLVESDDVDDLLQLCGLLSEGDPIEVRACTPQSAEAAA